MTRKTEVEESSGNVFADLGLPNPEERLAKAGLAARISEAIRSRRLTQTQAARILKIDHPKISRLLRGQLSGFSTERLMHSLTSSAATWKSPSSPPPAPARAASASSLWPDWVCVCRF